MKKFILLFLPILLVSCSSSKINRTITDPNWDALANESFLRWGETRLKSSADVVTGCYQGKAKETLELYKKEYLAQKDTPYYWIHIGNCFFVQESWSKAEFFYRMALDEAKSATVKSIALNNLGLIHFRYEQWEKGKAFLQDAIAKAPRLKVPRYNISQLYLQFGLFDKAIETLSDRSLQGEQDVDIYFSLANAYLYKGDINSSERYFKMIPKQHFRREDIAATYALFLIKKDQIKEANAIMDDRDRSGIPEITAISQKIERLLAQKMKGE